MQTNLSEKKYPWASISPHRWQHIETLTRPPRQEPEQLTGRLQMNQPHKLEDLMLPPEALDKHCHSSPNDPTAHPTSEALLRGHFAEAGYLVHDAVDGFIVVRADWSLSRHCDSLADLQAFARKVGLPQ